jgi:ketosteroid isomerase-like protein|uniref:SnoaL-like domain-containing protein n=1 Tax=Phaeodactylum tricornutum TaxID=2850 RepID=A0A8J9X8B5_PHATR
MRRQSLVVGVVVALQPNPILAFSTSRSPTLKREHPRWVNNQKRRPSVLSAVSPIDTLVDSWKALWEKPTAAVSLPKKHPAQTVQNFISAYNERDYNTLENMVDPDIEFDDTAYPKPCRGLPELERRWRLTRNAQGDKRIQVAVDDIASSTTTVGIRFHLENVEGEIPNGRGAAFFQLSNDGLLVKKVFWVQESAQKGGEASLQTLNRASKVMKLTGYNKATATSTATKEASEMIESSFLSLPEKYFAAWNRRDMSSAVALFADTVTYDDTAFPEPFSGKTNLSSHLYKCSNAFPSTFTFQVDKVADAGDRISVLWHVENDGDDLPFTRGCSFYNVDTKRNEILDGIDFVEPGPIKLGGFHLLVSTVRTNLEREPARYLPLISWIAYIYIVFFSNGILPGANALELEQRTWEEVRDLSLNFFLVSPLLQLSFSPTVHPMLEGVFNLLLSWAAMFAGFLSDDRREKPNVAPMLPIVIGMQFLTSAFLMPYLVLRSTEESTLVAKDALPKVAQLAEARALAPFLASVGTGSIVWGLVGRMADFGDLSTRWSSFIDLLSIDRVGSSFVVDLALFWLFQSFLIDDDLKRRGIDPETSELPVFLGKYVPFFGMALYLAMRPPLPLNIQNSQND